MFDDWEDFLLPGGVPVEVRRFYSTALLSVRSDFEPFGPGWRAGFQRELRQTLDGYAYTTHEGVEIPLDDLQGMLARTGRLLVPSAGMELRRNPDGTLTLIQFDSSAHVIRAIFRRKPGSSTEFILASLARNPHNRVDFEYDAAWRPKRMVQTRTSRAVDLKYSPAGRLVEVSVAGLPARVVVRYAFDARQRLVRVVDKAGLVTAYEYDASGRMRSEVKPTGGQFTFSYDAQGRCVRATGADGFQDRWLRYAPEKRRTEVINSHGDITVFEYNERGQVTEVRSPLNAKECFQYNDDGQMVAQVMPNKGVLTYAYDAQGHLCGVSLPDQRRIQVRFDDEHRQVELVDWKGIRWGYVHDEDGNLITTSDPQGAPWHYTYNKYGELVSVTNAMGARFQLDWDTLGRNVARGDWEGGVWRTEFDSRDRVVEECNPLGLRTRYEYNDADDLVAVHAPDGRTWRYGYDAFGRLISERLPDGRESTRSFSACGRLLMMSDAAGSTFAFRWDTEPSRLLEIRDGRGNTYQLDYDAEGRPVRKVFWDGRAYTYAYDDMSLCTALVDPGGGRTEYAYDLLGQMVSRRTPDGKETQYTYDANMQLASVQSPDSETHFERDIYGQIVCEVQDGIRIESQFDELGRRRGFKTGLGLDVQYEWNRNSDCVGVRLAGVELGFTRDAIGREVRRALPGGLAMETTYDAVGRLSSQVLGREAAAWGNVEAGLLRRGYKYDANGRMSEWDDSLRGRATFTHDGEGRLTGIARSGALAELFAYDRAGNRVFKTSLAQLGSVTRSPADPEPLDVIRAHGTHEEVMVHAPGNQLASKMREGNSVVYSHDPQGRRTRRTIKRHNETDEVWQYHWDSLGQLVALVRPDGAVWTYGYDGLGRRVHKKGPTREFRYVWDGESLVHILENGQVSSSWAYEPDSVVPLLRTESTQTCSVLSDHAGSASEWVDDEGRFVWVSREGPWGEPGDSTIEGPRFQGHWYDAESGLHYNRFRYYEPDSACYISPDPIGISGGFNEYAYVPSPLQWVDPFGLLGGGPFTWRGGRRYSRSPGQTGGRTHTLPTSKCMATLSAPNGDRYAFVSGMPDDFRRSLPADVRANYRGNPSPPLHAQVLPHVEASQNGNWTHAEIHLINHVMNNLDRYQGHTINIHIDRPPCTRNGAPCCSNAVARMGEDGRMIEGPLLLLLRMHGVTPDVSWDAHPTRRSQASKKC
ncbi:Putative deoxyribonuclease RhsC [Myxococcus stipitatus]